MTQEYLKSLFDYDADNGIFTRKISRGGCKAGTVAGRTKPNTHGYIDISVDKKLIGAHRLAWLYEYGELPEEIDHINHNRADNRIANLRAVSRKENFQNISMYKNNSSGVTGVFWLDKFNKWYAYIQVNKKRKHLGYFKKLDDAVKARQEAEVKYGYHKNHGKEVA